MKQNYGLKSSEKEVGVTDTAGEVTLPALYAGGSYAVRAALPGYCPRGNELPQVGSQNWIDRIEIVTEPATATAKGRVVDARGAPVAGADVITDFGPASVTDENGEFILQQMPDWPVRLDACKGNARGANLDPKGRIVWKSEQVIVLR